MEKPRYYVTGRNEVGGIPTAGPSNPPTHYLQLRTRGSSITMSIEVSREEFHDMPIGTEVDVILKPVRS